MTKRIAEKRAYWDNHAKTWKESGESKRSYAHSTSYLDEFGHYYSISSIRPDLFVTPPGLGKVSS